MILCRQKGKLFSLLIGIAVGVLVSPVTYLLQFPDSELTPRQLQPLCRTTLSEGSSLAAAPEESNQSNLSRVYPPPKYLHNSSLLSQQELQHQVEPPHNPAVRYKYLENELAPRRLLLVGVVTAKKYLDTRALGIYRTWGKEIQDIYFFSSQADDGGPKLPIITLPGVNDTQYPPQRKVYHMLKYMHDHYIDQFDFFMRSDDDVYVKVDMLLKLLQNTNPAQDIYMGCPGFGKPDDRDRIKLSEHEHYCMGGPGVIFSRAALRKLAPHLDACLQSVVVSYNEDVEVGRCVSKMLKLQCTWSWETAALFWTDYKRILPKPELYTSEEVKKAITLHPLKDPKLMYRVHQYLKELELKKLLQKVTVLQGDVERVTGYLPQEMSRYDNHRWLWYDSSINPKSRFELPMWEYFNSTRYFLNYEHMPVIGLPGSIRNGINTALEVLLDIMNGKDDQPHPFVPPYHLFDGFTLSNPSSGVEYFLHMSVHRESVEEPIEYVANIFLPFQGAGMASFQEAGSVLNTVVHMIIGVAKSHDISDFIAMFQASCVRHPLNVHLHLVMFGKNEKAKSTVLKLQQMCAKELVSIHETENTDFSHAYSYNFVAGLLEESDLMLFFDHNFVFTPDFLAHCRMNAVRGRQAYFPVLFSFYKPELVQKYIQRPPQMLISADTGFFLRYNYQVVAVYKSDYDRIGGFGSNQGGTLNDDVRFVDKLLATDLYVMRALEPFLRRNYKPRNCKGLTGNSHSACMNSRADAIGSKKILASMIISNDLLDKV